MSLTFSIILNFAENVTNTLAYYKSVDDKGKCVFCKPWLQRILKEEQELYEKEGLGVKKISFVDNQVKSRLHIRFCSPISKSDAISTGLILLKS